MKKDEARRDSAATNAPGEDAGGDTLAAVSALMAERRRFEGWIAALDARRSTTPEHVFARVNGDYQKRLDAVIEQLTSHTDGLRREMDALDARLVSLRDEQQRAQDERAEAELRAHVGELTGDQWQSTASASDERLADLARQHGEVEGEITRTRELLEATQRPAPTPPEGSEPVSDEAEAAMHVPEASAPAEPEPAVAPPAAPRMSAPAPRMSVPAAAMAEPEPEPERAEPVRAAEDPQHALQIQERHSMPVAAIPPEPAEPLVGEPPRGSGASRKSSFDELAFLSSVVDTPSGTVEPAPQDEPDEVTRRQTFARRSQEDAIVNLADSGSIPLVSKIPDQQRDMAPRATRADQMIRRDSVSDGAKTLKCGECGSMNYPTEWYCERCGAELASL